LSPLEQGHIDCCDYRNTLVMFRSIRISTTFHG
jgi:hypothetical protein